MNTIGAATLSAAFMFATTAQADRIIIGTPGQVAAAMLGHDLGESIGQALQAGAAYAKSKEEVNIEIERARLAFWENYPDGPKIAEAREEYATLLFYKDLFYLGLFIAEGMNYDSMERIKNMNLLTGGEVDGGIRSQRGIIEFAKWVDAVRKSMGASKPGELLFATSPQKMLDAITANMPAYEKYREARDEIEYFEVMMAKQNAAKN